MDGGTAEGADDLVEHVATAKHKGAMAMAARPNWTLQFGKC